MADVTMTNADADPKLQNSNDLVQWKEVTKQMNVLLSKKLTLESYWTRQTRPDGRLLSQCRSLSLTKAVLRKTTNGSAMVSLNATRVVVAGIVLQVGRIIVPNGGGDVNVTVSSASSTQADYTNLQSWLERTLQETLDLQQLIISPTHAFSFQIGLQILNEAAGNLKDCCLLAALAACQDTILPETTSTMDAKSSSKQSGIVYAKPVDTNAKIQRRIQLPVVAIPLTLGLWTSKSEDDTTMEWIVDPTRIELQHGCVGQLTIVLDARTNRILQCDLASLKAIDPTMLALAVRMAEGRAKELMQQLI
ncbi:hypothetical protein MPSEU_000445600 [Mayamaea pseudoterrestris]|nr:hypothetical protein MPSEU_000445600 [Mayamaea pseudoterrestris]